MSFLKDLFHESPRRPLCCDVFWSWLGSFLGISAVVLLHSQLLAASDTPLIIGSFGASAVLVYGAPHSPLAQPRNLIGGHFISALIGVSCFLLIGQADWLACALSVSLAIAAMHATGTLHPPGGATALIAVIGSPAIHELGYLYALVPVASGASIMLVVGLIVNRLPRSRCYRLFNH